MKLLTAVGFTGLRNVSAALALAAACAVVLLPSQVVANTNPVVVQAAPIATVAATAPIASEAPKGILASGQIHKRTTPAISLANEPELPFYFKSWMFALLCVLVVVAIKRPWNSAKAKAAERRSNRANRADGLITPFAGS